VSHADLFRAVLPELFALYSEAARKAKGSVLDAWRLVTRRSHTVNQDGISVPNFKSVFFLVGFLVFILFSERANFAERTQLICGETTAVTRVLLRKAIEREMSAVRLVAEVLKSQHG
jgi:hypothetical protein